MSGPFDNVSPNKFVELIDGRAFTFRIEIFNEDGKMLQIKKAGVDLLEIEDNILNPFLTGVLILKNPFDMLERQTEQNVGEEQVTLNTFRFRGDARDYVNVFIAPAIGTDLDDVEHVSSDFYTLKQTFVIHKIEDVPSGNATTKTKKLYLHDLKYQKLIEKDLYWSSSAAAIRQGVGAITKPISQLTNEQRSIQTGVALKDMIQQSIPGQKFEKNWDVGAREIFYTSPAGSKAIDDIMYMSSEHVSSDDTENQPCIFRHERFSKSWSLMPLKKYFTGGYDSAAGQPGPLQNETFYISNEVDETGDQKPEPKSPTGNTGLTNNVHFPDLGLIKGYVFSEMPGLDQQNILISTPVLAYEPYTKEFQFYHKQQAIENMFNFFKSNVTDTLKGGSTGPYTDFFINKTKLENRNVNLVYTTHTDRLGTLLNSRNTVLKKALLGGPALMFSIIGMPNRRAGRFISVDRQNPYIENDYDSKLLGQYFVTQVTHRFSNSGYVNNILGVKPYFYNKVDFNNDIK